MSGTTATDPRWYPEILSIIARNREVARRMIIEITESVAMEDNTMRAFAALAGVGVSLSIDDFGTGYSSLSHLKRFDIYKLKIDQSFVRDVVDDPEDQAIVTAIVNMAHSLGMITLAEGVETLEQLSFLKQQHCDEIQGYLYSYPLEREAFAELLRSWICCRSSTQRFQSRSSAEITVNAPACMAIMANSS